MVDAGYPVNREVIINGTDSAGAVGEFLRERVTSAFPVITTDHANIHNEEAYSASGTISVAQGASTYIRVTTPAGRYIHFKPAGFTASGGPVTVTFIENPTSVGTGVALSEPNRNRLSSQTASTVCAITATLSGGTVISTLFIPSSTQGVNRLGGSTASAEEWVLKRSEDYAVKVLNSAASSSTIGYDLFWYEEPSA